MRNQFYIVLAACIFWTSGYGISQAQTISEGKKVTFEYKLTIEGQLIDTSEGREPITFVQGDGKIIPGLAKQLEGLKAGDEKTIVVSPEDGYGPVNDDAIKEVPRTILPKDVELQVGQVYEFQGEDGATFPGIVKEIKEQTAVMNFNHPLAGKELTFDIKIVKVE